MPRKTSSEGKPTDTAGIELKSVRVELTPPVHKQLRMKAAEHDVSMAAYVRGLIEDHLAKKK
jgi:predicted HicB family RNase H-like nuclease